MKDSDGASRASAGQFDRSCPDGADGVGEQRQGSVTHRTSQLYGNAAPALQRR